METLSFRIWDACGSEASTLTDLAALIANASLVDLLQEHAKEKSSTSPSSALVRAAENNNVQAVDLLVGAGVPVDHFDVATGWTPLMAAARFNSTEALQRLIELGANVNACNSENGETALFLACYHNCIQVIQTLIQSGADIEATASMGLRPLISAAGYGHADVVVLLAEHGVDVNATLVNGWSAYVAAAREGNLEILRLLEGLGANTARDGFNAFFQALESNHVETVRHLVTSAKIDINKPVHVPMLMGATPLIVAAAMGHVDMVRLFLKLGANSAIAMNDGRTAADAAKTQDIRNLILSVDAKTSAETDNSLDAQWMQLQNDCSAFAAQVELVPNYFGDVEDLKVLKSAHETACAQEDFELAGTLGVRLENLTQQLSQQISEHDILTMHDRRDALVRRLTERCRMLVAQGKNAELQAAGALKRKMQDLDLSTVPASGSHDPVLVNSPAATELEDLSYAAVESKSQEAADIVPFPSHQHEIDNVVGVALAPQAPVQMATGVVDELIEDMQAPNAVAMGVQDFEVNGAVTAEEYIEDHLFNAIQEELKGGNAIPPTASVSSAAVAAPPSSSQRMDGAVVARPAVLAPRSRNDRTRVPAQQKLEETVPISGESKPARKRNHTEVVAEVTRPTPTAQRRNEFCVNT